jgi:hypothetical protein
LLAAEAVMGDEVVTQRQAWAAYDQWLKDLQRHVRGGAPLAGHVCSRGTDAVPRARRSARASPRHRRVAGNARRRCGTGRWLPCCSC